MLLPDLSVEHVVLLDRLGRPCGVLPKSSVHTASTPLHLAFSCHVVRGDGAMLLSRRAPTKATWPGVWSNACCGHPQAGETLTDAVRRRLRQELGVCATRLEIALPDFAYRAVMPDGTVEHELCPVVVARVDGAPAPDDAEVADVAWITWPELCRRVEHSPVTLSPWSVTQVEELVASGFTPESWLTPTYASRSFTWPYDIAIDVPRAVPRPPTDDVAGRVGAVLRDHLDRNGSTLAGIDSNLAPIAEAIEGLVAAGGKRLRPAFVYWGFRATGAPPDEAVWPVAAAVELLHTFALLHDDVMDRSARRRGRPSAHETCAHLPPARGQLGDSDWFGISAAVLAGDLAFVCADELIDSIDVPIEAQRRVRAVYSTMRREVMAGQYLDLHTADDPQADEHIARRIAMLKSARYTVTRPLQLGSALAAPEAASAVLPALQTFGDAVGLAFQLRDDVLGLFGDPAVTGKSVLDDLRSGKPTLPVLRAFRLADERQRKELAAAWGDPELDEERAATARDIVADTGALASVEVLIAAEHARASAALAAVPEPARSALADLAADAVRRAS